MRRRWRRRSEEGNNERRVAWRIIGLREDADEK